MLIVVFGGLQQGLGCILRTLSGKVRANSCCPLCNDSQLRPAASRTACQGGKRLYTASTLCKLLRKGRSPRLDLVEDHERTFRRCYSAAFWPVFALKRGHCISSAMGICFPSRLYTANALHLSPSDPRGTHIA